MKAIRNLKERMIGFTGSISGAASIMGSWQVCHNVCLGIIAALGILGITAAGMPLLFLTKLAVPFWIAALALLLVVIGFYVKKKCISLNLIAFNSGLIIAGIPFEPLQNFRIYFWIIGGMIVGITSYIFIKGKIMKRLAKNEKKL